MNKVSAFDSYIAKPSINAKLNGKVFKATGGVVKLTKAKKTTPKQTNTEFII